MPRDTHRRQRTQHEIFGRISDDGELGQHHEVCAGSRGSPRASDAREVAVDSPTVGLSCASAMVSCTFNSILRFSRLARQSVIMQPMERRMKIGVPAEQVPGERRVALVPASIAALKKAGATW